MPVTKNNTAAVQRDFTYIYSTLSMKFLYCFQVYRWQWETSYLSFQTGHFISVDNNTSTEGKCDVRFNKVILHLLHVGILDQWFRDIKYTTFLSSAAQTSLPTGECVKLNLLHTQSAVNMLLLGLVLSFIAFHSEILFCRNACSLQL